MNFTALSPSQLQAHLPTLEKLLNDLSATASSKEKIRLLEEQKAQSSEYLNLLQELLQACCSPREVFFLKPIKNPQATSELNIDDLTVLDALRLLQSQLRGNKAVEFYQSFHASCVKNGRAFEADLLDRVLNKDLRVGVASQTINKVFKGLIPQQPYMRCSLVKNITAPEKWLSGNTAIYSQEKMDGMFVNFTVGENGELELASRSGSIFPNNPAFAPLKAMTKHMASNQQYHGELLVVDKATGADLPREVGNGILNSLAKESKNGTQFDPEQHALRFVVWDTLSLEDLMNGTSAEYTQRFDELQNLMAKLPENAPIALVNTTICPDINLAVADFKRHLADGKEGVCWKLASMKWQDGTSKDIIKLKNTFEVDLQIVDFVAGKGKNEHLFGSIRTQSADGKLIVDVSGFTDDLRLHIHQNREQYLGQIMAVKANSITQTDENTYSLFLPRFAEFRHDKSEADSFLRIQQQFEESINGYNPVEELQAKLCAKQAKKKKV